MKTSNSRVLFQQTIYIFKTFNVAKRFSHIYFSDLFWSQVNVGYCNKEEILRIEDVFYIYAGEKTINWDEPKPSVIRFTKRGKIIKEINAN